MKRSKSTKNSEFFARGKHPTLYHHFELSEVILRLKLIENLSLYSQSKTGVHLRIYGELTQLLTPDQTILDTVTV